ncbi:MULTISPECIES: hypothetical protein [Amycolatopsis]|uniref:Uncharacterized protein n=1 Tax=Amycolatopsis rubida TaxID=112413 RepID=A0A1I5YIM2_9PSEU|nr:MULTISPECIES: hypothetical protein [Amycolatopsis]OAP28104.1 hypothetical protein A4R44_01714 [Amycolatopsis sp. M39]SFQ44052.1 hypothetical protein SAMN05421854_112119 [Amycolatopsis rubida]
MSTLAKKLVPQLRDASRRWYADLLGVAPYLEWRIGDYQHEFGIIHSSYTTSELSWTADLASVGQPAGAVVFWHVENVPAAPVRQRSCSRRRRGVTD